MERSKKKSFLLMIISAVFCFILGLGFFLVEKKESTGVVTANAEEISTENIQGFDMKDIKLNITPGEESLHIHVSLNDEMATNLTKKTEENKFLWWTASYNPTPYYLRVLARPRTGEVETKSYYYHIDPKRAHKTAQKLVVEGNTAILNISFNEDFETTYDYFVEYGYVEEKIETQHFHSYQYTYKTHKYYSIASAPNHAGASVQGLAREILLDSSQDLSSEQIDFLNYAAGYKTDETYFLVQVKVKKIDENGRIYSIWEKFQARSIYIGRPQILLQQYMQIKGYTEMSDFNLVLKNPDDTEERIVLVAEGFEYTYSDYFNIASGDLVITYKSFTYDKFHIRLQNNNPNEELKFYYHIPVTDVTTNTVSNTVTLKYNFDDVQRKVLAMGWICDLKPEDFDVWDGTKHIGYKLTEDDLTITFEPEYEDELQNLFIMATAEIIPDTECTIALKYSSLEFKNGTIEETEKMQATTMLYSQYIKNCHFSYFKDTEMYEIVTDALVVPELKNEVYFTPSNIIGKNNGESSFTLNVEYDYNTLLKTTDNLGNVYFRAATKPYSLEYGLNDLNISIPEGYRISSFTTPSNDVDVSFNEENASDLSVTLNISTKEKTIVPLHLNYSNFWLLKIVYMQTYKDTPFAEKQEVLKSVKVGEYNFNNLTLANVKKLLGRNDDMKICNIAVPDKKVETKLTSESTYTATLSYGIASLKKIDEHGNKSEVRVPLTCYVDFCNDIGDDFSILYLNTEERKYFETSNEVARENLYGFFSAAVFEQTATDIQDWFLNYTGSGNIVVFNTREVRGSSIYQFFDRLRENVSLLYPSATVGMAFCEILNDDNKVVNTQFFYMDNMEGFISNGGADNAEDDDNAMENAGKDFVEKVEPVLKELGSKAGSFLAIAGGVGLIAGIVFLIALLKIKFGGVMITASKRVGKTSATAPSEKKSEKKKRKGNKEKSHKQKKYKKKRK